MSVLHSKRVVAVVAAIAVAGGLVAVGIAGVLSQTVVVDGTNIHFRVVRTVANDFDSGWHMHPGLAIVQVQEGSLQITQGTCTAKTVGAGETLVEVPYTPVRAVATGFVRWTTTFLVHYEEPALIPVATSPCP